MKTELGIDTSSEQPSCLYSSVQKSSSNYGVCRTLFSNIGR
ncbi:hypothetical protein SOVF_095820 [Spinacia oleracea]|nr:hypothetical protein SOVF_095820 [Spinacia oleracea]